MCLFYRKPDCRGGAESQHLVVPSRMAQQGVRSIPMGQCAAGTSRDHATLEAEEWGWFGAESGYFVTTSFQFLGDRPKHISVHTNSTQLRHLNLLYYRRLGKQV